MYRKILTVAIATLLFSGRLCAQDLGAGFVLPTIPSHITVAEERANYLALHYWDNLDMSKQALVESKSLYDLTTKPRLYLLDKEHRVLLKNTTPAKVEEYLSAR